MGMVVLIFLNNLWASFMAMVLGFLLGGFSFGYLYCEWVSAWVCGEGGCDEGRDLDALEDFCHMGFLSCRLFCFRLG